MPNKNLIKLVKAFLLFGLFIFLPACVKDSEYSKRTKEAGDLDIMPYEKRLLAEEKTEEEITRGKNKEAATDLNNENNGLKNGGQETKKELQTNKKRSKKESAQSLNFWVENTTGKTVYVTCFSYIKKRPFMRWRWDKSQIYKIEDNQKALIDIDIIPDEQEKKDVYGYLAVFDNEKEALDSTFELLNDKYKVDLDLIQNLKDKVVKVGVEKYGIQGKLLDYTFTPLKKKGEKYPELDFVVENRTGKTLYVTCFVYQLKNEMPVWRFDKTPVIKLMPGESGIIDVDTIAGKYERVYLRGYLAVFDEDEKEKAEKITYELLQPQNKIPIERLAALKNKKIVLDIERYGIVGEMIDYSVKPIRRIDFRKALKNK